MTIESEFQAAIEAAGLPAPPLIHADGRLHRFGTNGKANDKAGYYVLHIDDNPAGIFGDHRTKITGVWTENGSESMSPEQLRAHYARIEELKRQRAAERKRAIDEGADRAKTMWDLAKPAPDDHPYLDRKGVPVAGLLRVDIDGNLLVPMTDRTGELRNLERISPEGEKKGLPGAERSGLFFAFGDWSADKRLLIAEGFSTAASLHHATGLATIASFDCGNLPKVAAIVKRENPEAQVLVCADDDQLVDGNPGRTKAAEAARILDCETLLPDCPTDFNDMHLARGLEAVRDLVLEAIESEWPPPESVLVATRAEIAAAQLTPRCFVENYLYATVGQVIGQGGTGKTTLILHEAINLALGRDIWGMRTVCAGKTLIVTKEDERCQLLARLREVMASMELSESESETVRRSVLILDVTGSSRKLLTVRDRNVERTAIAQRIVERYRNSGFAQTIFDPAVSFGASESLVNDNEQALIDVARFMVGELGCAVRYVHHVSQNVARSGTQDQYAGRGGTAFADGSRMICVIKPYDVEGNDNPPYGCHQDADSSLIVLARPKMSYARANLPKLWIKRTGFAFEHFVEQARSSGELEKIRADQVEQYLIDQFQIGAYHTRRTLDDKRAVLGMKVRELKSAISTLESLGRIVERDLPADRRRGQRKTFLCPVSCHCENPISQ